MIEEESEEYVFCHNDIGQHNVLVDAKSLEIKAIIDWKFSGFFPRWVEGALWKDVGHALTLGDEDRLRSWLVGVMKCVSCDITLDIGGIDRIDFRLKLRGRLNGWSQRQKIRMRSIRW